MSTNASPSIEDKRAEIARIARMHGVGRIALFGSFARGDATEKSDVDFLIEVIGPTTPWFPGALIADLEDSLGRRVDVVEEKALRQEMRTTVLTEAKAL